ncbi:MAG TPA: hypothetical protein VJM13_02690 [Sphingopyxis sp.]|nr:hypothetical protein [Sphingopyxis sp.]
MIGRFAAVAIAAGLVAGSSPVAMTAPAAAGLCRAGETPVYSCRFGRKIGSVCGGAKSVTYRFGSAAKTEMEIASKPNWSNVRLGFVTGQQGGHQSHIRFTRGDTHYIVFEGANGQAAINPGHSYSGIAIVAGADGGKELGRLDCGNGQDASAMAEAVRNRAPAMLRERLDETTDGPFDGWF